MEEPARRRRLVGCRMSSLAAEQTRTRSDQTHGEIRRRAGCDDSECVVELLRCDGWARWRLCERDPGSDGRGGKKCVEWRRPNGFGGWATAMCGMMSCSKSGKTATAQAPDLGLEPGLGLLNSWCWVRHDWSQA